MFSYDINVQLCSDWLLHSAAQFSSSHGKQTDRYSLAWMMERLDVQPSMFEPVSGEEEDTDFEEQPIVRRLEMEAIEW